MKRKVLFFLLPLMALIVLSCKKKEEVKPHNEVNWYVYELMKDWYFWNENIPQVDPDAYDTPEDLMNDITYKTYDHWSFIMDSVTYFNYFSSGEFQGYGCGFKVTSDNKLYISYVYSNSPMAAAGVSRGYRITSVNGASVESLLASGQLNQALSQEAPGVSTRFGVLDLAGTAKEISVAKSSFAMNTVLHYEVKDLSSRKAGYLVFNSFVQTSKAELDQAFTYFKANGISDLILDLRYNGGGSVDIANYLSSCIGGTAVANNVFGLTRHNKNKTSYDNNAMFQPSGYDLNLNRLFVITTGNSASASELVINGLKPYMDVYLIGSKTHGKPVGMYGWSYKGKMIVPISFEILNKNNEGRYFSGIEVNSSQTDDVTVPFGNPEEDCLKEALFYIENGYFHGATARLSSREDEVLKQHGFNAVTGAW